MVEAKGEVTKKAENLYDLPIGLRYFHAVDVLTEGVPLKDEKYFDILVYEPNEDQPRIKILRIMSNYVDGTIGKQDEIELAEKRNRIQFNAKCDKEGQYLEYPENFSDFSYSYLGGVVMTFAGLVAMEGSKININNSVTLVSKDGSWVREEKAPFVAKKISLETPKLKNR